MQRGQTPRDTKDVEAMGVLSVVCPNCRSRLSVQDVPGIQDKILACPICKYKAKVSLYQMGQAGKGGQGASDEATRLPGSFGQQVKTDTGQMRVLQTGQICELRMGSQVLGRLAQSGTADLQIGSDTYKDEYMSRRHVQIDVVRTALGIEHHLVEIGSKNIIQLNGRDIMRGDEIVLNFGDKLTLGKTDIVLEETNDDATKVI